MAAGSQAQKGICALLVILVNIRRISNGKNLWLVLVIESQEPVIIIREILIIIKLSPTRFDNIVIIPALLEF